MTVNTRFHLVCEGLHKGGMGILHLVYDQEGQELYILKELNTESLEHYSPAQIKDKSHKEFRHELSAVGLKHPNIVAYYGSATVELPLKPALQIPIEPKTFLCMEFLDWSFSSEDILRKKGFFSDLQKDYLFQYRNFQDNWINTHKENPFPWSKEKIRFPALNLEEFCKHKKDFLSRKQVRRIAIETVSALCYAHRNNMLHRDIKPSNIVLCHPEMPEDPHQAWSKVVDFGIARTVGRITMNLGTFEYTAPESWKESKGRMEEPRDIYSFGCTLYELLTGQPPFYDFVKTDSPGEWGIMHTSVPVDMLFRKTYLEKDIKELLTRCLDKEPENRPSADELSEWIHEISWEKKDREIVAVHTGTPDEILSQHAEYTSPSTYVAPQGESPQALIVKEIFADFQSEKVQLFQEFNEEKKQLRAEFKAEKKALKEAFEKEKTEILQRLEREERKTERLIRTFQRLVTLSFGLVCLLVVGVVLAAGWWFVWGNSSRKDKDSRMASPSTPSSKQSKRDSKTRTFKEHIREPVILRYVGPGPRKKQFHRRKSHIFEEAHKYIRPSKTKKRIRRSKRARSTKKRDVYSEASIYNIQRMGVPPARPRSMQNRKLLAQNTNHLNTRGKDQPLPKREPVERRKPSPPPKKAVSKLAVGSVSSSKIRTKFVRKERVEFIIQNKVDPIWRILSSSYLAGRKGFFSQIQPLQENFGQVRQRLQLRPGWYELQADISYKGWGDGRFMYRRKMSDQETKSKVSFKVRAGQKNRYYLRFYSKSGSCYRDCIYVKISSS